MRELDEGRSFLVSRNGRPIGELRPLRRERLIDTRVALAAFTAAPPINSHTFRRDVDTVLDQDAEPRA